MRVWAAFVIMTLAVSHAVHGADRITGKEHGMRSPVVAQHGMVATAHPLASQVGLDILQGGGNAVDAAIAINAALGVMEPSGCGIGGDLFVLYWDAKSDKLYGLNASGRSGAGLSLDELKARGLTKMPELGGLPITVPGCVDGWFAMHERFGSQSMKKLLAPAIRYAREGHPVAEVVAFYWSRVPARYGDFPQFLATYAPGGHAPRSGDVFRNPALATTYEIIARGGRNAFYGGEIAEKIVAAVRQHGGALGLDDLALQHAEWVEPVGTTYRGYNVWELPPNTQGVAVLQMLNILEHIDLAVLGHNSADYLHLLVETKKIVYEDRARYYADPEFGDLPIEQLLSKEYTALRSQLYRPERANSTVPAGDVALRQGDTTYFTVVDAKRNVVSWIQSNYMGFGSGVVPEGTGFCLQNRGNLFSLDAAHANAYAPRKRPFHTIIPAMLTRAGKPVFGFGVMGGDMQPQGHVQVLANILDFGMNVQEAGDAPRFYHTGSTEPTGELMKNGGELQLESGVRADVVRALALRGHHITHGVGTYGGYQGIWIDYERGVLIGATESRKDGVAIGY